MNRTMLLPRAHSQNSPGKSETGNENHFPLGSEASPAGPPPRPPLSETSQNPILARIDEQHLLKTDEKSDSAPLRPKARILFADQATNHRKGDNWVARTPDNHLSSSKFNGNRSSLHATSPRTRRGSGRPPIGDSDASCSSQHFENGSSSRYTSSASKAGHLVVHGNSFPSSGLLYSPRAGAHRSGAYNHSHLQSHSQIEHFELEQDKNFWKDHNVQVLIRVRPLSSAETAADGISRCLRQESPHALTWTGQPESRFTFDHVACETLTQENLFEVAGLPMVDNCIAGYNSCIFAYGQTGSGKTFTMLGDIEEQDRQPNPRRGMIPRIFEYLFTKIQMEEAAHRQEHLKFTCKCSFLEIYNEQITDLLEPSSTNLQMHEEPRKGVYVENLKEIEVNNARDVMPLLLQAAANRRVAQTKMNQESSRSHSVFTCVIESKCVRDSMTSFRFGRLNLVDLAGSERQKASGSEGERLREAANINKSLSTLGLVIMILVDLAHGKQRHVPYRDSKLTFLLQDSLGGNSKTAIIANVSPSICCANETLSTLKFAQRAKFIQNNAIINEDASGDIIALRSQIQDLKEELEKLRKENQTAKSSSSPIISGTSRSDMTIPVEDSVPLCWQQSIGSTQADIPTKKANLKKKNTMEEVLLGCLRREQAAMQALNRLDAEKQQLDLLIQGYEREIEYGKTMLQLKEEKIQRLECVADTILSAEDYFQNDNKALQEELRVLKKRMNQNPELLRFALENKRLIEQLRRYESFHGDEQELLVAEITSLKAQVLNLLDDNLKQMRHEEESLLSTPVREATELLCTQEVDQNCSSTCAHKVEPPLQLQYKLQEIQEALEKEQAKRKESDDRVLLQIRQLDEARQKELTPCMQLEEAMEKINEAKNMAEIQPTIQAEHKSIQILKRRVQDILIKKEQKIHGQTGNEDSQKQKEVECGKEQHFQRDVIDTLQEETVLVHGKTHDKDDQSCSTRCAHKVEPPLQLQYKLQEIQEALEKEQAKRKESDDRVLLQIRQLDEARQKEHTLCMQLEEAMEKINEAKAMAEIQPTIHAEHNSIQILNRRVQDILIKKEQKIHGQTGNKDSQKQKEVEYGKEQHFQRDVIDSLQEETVLVHGKTHDKDGKVADLESDIEREHVNMITSLEEGNQALDEALQEIKNIPKGCISENDERLETNLIPKTVNSETNDTFHSVLQRVYNIAKDVEYQVRNLCDATIAEVKGKRNVDSERATSTWGESSLRHAGERQMEIMESQVTRILAPLEERLQQAEAVWRQEKQEILLELNATRLDCAEKISEASEALRRFKDGQEIIKEAEFTVTALMRVNENAKKEKLTLLNQWQRDRDCLINETDRIKDAFEEQIQVREKEVQQILLEIKKVMDWTEEEIGALVHYMESTITSFSLDLRGISMISEQIRSMFHVNVGNFKSLSELSGQNLHEPNAFHDSAASDDALGLTQNLESQATSAQDAHSLVHRSSGGHKTTDMYRLEEVHTRNNQLEVEKSHLKSELNRREEELAILQSKLKESRSTIIHVQASNAKTEKVLQEKETKLTDLMTQLAETTIKLHQSEQVIKDRYEREQTLYDAQQATQKASIETSRVLNNFDSITSIFLEKLHFMIAQILDKPGAGDAWICFADNLQNLLSKFEDDANACIKCSNLIWQRLENTLAEKKLLEEELERKQELLKGSFFDLSLLQEITVESKDIKEEMNNAIIIIRSLQQELEKKGEQLENEKEKNTNDLTFLKENLSEVQRYSASLESEIANLKKDLDEALKKSTFLKEKLEDKRHTNEVLELELAKMKSLVGQRTIQSFEGIDQESSLTGSRKDQSHAKMIALNEELVATRSLVDEHKRLASEAQQIAEMSKHHARVKEEEVKLLERSVAELESTVGALESQMEILRREAEMQQLIKEDLEMELQALRHQMYIQAENIHFDQEYDNGLQSRNQSSVETKKRQLLEAQTEIMALRKEAADKDMQIKSFKFQIEELIAAAENQAAAHHQKLISLESMVEELNLGKGEPKQLLSITKKAGDKSAAAKCSTSPFKCITSGLAEQINFEMDEQLYLNRRRINELEDLAASRQKEIFRLNKRLAEAETMTYDVLRDLLGVKSDITSHASWLDHKELQKISRTALHQTKVALQKEELEALRAQYIEERESWFEDINRRQAEVVAAHVATEKLRQQGFILKTENKRLKSDLSRQKKRLFKLQDKMKSSQDQGSYEL